MTNPVERPHDDALPADQPADGDAVGGKDLDETSNGMSFGWGVLDPETVRRAAALPGFQSFRTATPVFEQPQSDASDETPGDHDQNPPVADPEAASVEPEPAAAQPASGAHVGPPPARVDLAGIEGKLQQIVDVLDRRLEDLATARPRLKDIGLTPRVPVRPPRESGIRSQATASPADAAISIAEPRADTAQGVEPKADIGEARHDPQDNAFDRALDAASDIPPAEGLPANEAPARPEEPETAPEHPSEGLTAEPGSAAARRRRLRVVDAVLILGVVALIALWGFLFMGGDLRLIPGLSNLLAMMGQFR